MGFFDWLKGNDKKVSKNVYQEEADFVSEYEKYIGAANQGEAVALYKIGLCYNEGNGVKKDEQKAIQYLMEAANKGIKDSYYWLGMIYESGEEVQKDLNKSFEYYKSGAERGDYAAEAMLGKDYLYGIGTVKNIELAYKWLTKTSSDIFFSGYYLGDCLLQKGDKVEAIKILEKAIKEGCANQPQAMELLKKIYASCSDENSKRKLEEFTEKQKRSSDLLDELIASFEEDGTIL